MKINKMFARKISYDTSKERSKKDIKYIVIHYTGNKNDTAYNNAKYFATSNKREAGAHYFIDSKGIIYQSIKAKNIAWAVGGLYSLNDGGGKYYGKCTNNNSISIELCNCLDTPTKKQVTALKQLIKHIRKYCPNANNIIRHWDVNGKECPKSMIGKDNEIWKELLDKIK